MNFEEKNFEKLENLGLVPIYSFDHQLILSNINPLFPTSTYSFQRQLTPKKNLKPTAQGFGIFTFLRLLRIRLLRRFLLRKGRRGVGAIARGQLERLLCIRRRLRFSSKFFLTFLDGVPLPAPLRGEPTLEGLPTTRALRASLIERENLEGGGSLTSFASEFFLGGFFERFVGG